VHTKTLIAQLHIYLDGRLPSSLLHLSPPAHSAALPMPSRDDLLDKSKRILTELVSTIQSVSSSSPSSQATHERALASQRLEELLTLHDQLIALITRVEEPPLLSPTPISGAATPATIGTPIEDNIKSEGEGAVAVSTAAAIVAGRDKSKTNLKGLGLKLDTLGISDSDRVRWSQVAHQRHGADSTEEDGEQGGMSTRRVDKGKARASPEPELVEKVLSPTRLLVDGGILDNASFEVDDEGEIEEEEEEEEKPGATATDR
jgi:hypothetical protein